MPKYLVELEDGRKFNVEADSPPEGDDLNEFLAGQGTGSQPPVTEEPAQPLAETALNQMKRGFLGLATKPVQAIANTQQAAIDLAGSVPVVGPAWKRGLEMLPAPARWLSPAMQDIEQRREEMSPVDPRNEWTATLAGAVPQVAGLIATGGVAGAPAALGLGGAMGAQSGFETAEDVGVTSPLGRLGMAGAFGATEALIERGIPGMGGIAGKQIAGGFAKRAGLGALSEFIEEPVTGAAQAGITRLAATDVGGGQTATGYDLGQLSPMDPRFWKQRAMEAGAGLVGGGVHALTQVGQPSSIESGESEVPVLPPEQHAQQSAAAVEAMQQAGADPEAMQFAVDQMLQSQGAGAATTVGQPVSQPGQPVSQPEPPSTTVQPPSTTVQPPHATDPAATEVPQVNAEAGGLQAATEAGLQPAPGEVMGGVPQVTGDSSPEASGPQAPVTTASVTPEALPVTTPAAPAQAPVTPPAPTDAGSTPAAGAIPETTAQQPQTTAQPPLNDPDSVGIKNANVDAYREAVGLPPMESRGGSTQADVESMAFRRVQANPNEGAMLVHRINEQGHEADDLDNAVLIYHEAQLRKRFMAAAKAAAEAPADQKDAARKIADDLAEAINAAHRAYRDTGTAWSDTGRARQMLARQDTEFGPMLYSYAAKGKSALTSEDIAMVAEASRVMKADEAAVAAKQEEKHEEDVKVASEQALPGLKAAARANITAAEKRKLLDQVRTKAARAKVALATSMGLRKAARSRPKVKVDGLPDHTKGTGIIATMERNGLLLGEPGAGGEWDWFNEMQKAAAVLNQKEPMPPQKANSHAAAGENMDDPRVMMAWLYQNVFAEPGGGVDIVNATEGLNRGYQSGAEQNAEGMSATSFNIGPADLGDAIMAEIQGRIMAKESGDVEDIEAQAEADLVAQEDVELGVGYDDLGGFKNLDVSGETAGYLNADIINEGADLVARGVRRFVDWSRAMIKKFGTVIRDYLQGVWQSAIKNSQVGALDIGKGEWDRKRRGVLKERRRAVAAQQKEDSKQEKLAGIRRNLVTAMVGEMAEGASPARAVENLTGQFGGDVFAGLDMQAMSAEAVEILAALNARAARAQSPAGIIERAQSEQRGVDHTLARQLAIAHIAANLNITEQALADAVRNDLSALVPDITLRETREALTDYGRTKKQSQDEIKKAQRELRQQATLKVKIEDAERGVAPLKTGLVRDKATAVVRELRAKLGDVMRKNKIAQTGPEQLATARSAVITRLKNQIEEATRLITGKAGPRDKRAGIAYDAEMLALQKERDELQAYYDDLNRPSESYQWNKQAERAAKAGAEFYRRRIATGNLGGKAKGVGHAMSDATKAAKAEAATAKAEFDALREAAGLPSKEANDRLLVRLDKRARELRAIIAAGAGPVLGPAAGPRSTTAEVDAARAEVKQLEKVRRFIAPKPNKARTPQSDARRAEAAEAATLRAIDQVERELAGEVRRQGPKPIMKSSKQQALEAHLASLRGIQADAEAAKVPRRDPEEIAHDKLQKRLKEQEWMWADKLRRGDFSVPTKRQIELTKEELQLKYRRDQNHRKWLDAKLARELADAGAGRRTVETMMKAAFFARSIVTGGEFSALGRQGKLAFFMNPLGFMKGAVRATFKALRSETAEFEVLEDIRQREHGLKGIYKSSGLAINDPTDYSAAMAEGQARSAWMRDMANMPWKPSTALFKAPAAVIEATGRAYTAAIAQMRADEFDRMAAKFERRVGRSPTREEYRIIATMVNDATGAGKLGVGHGRYVAPAGVKTGLSMAFFSPSYWASRFRLLTAMPLGEAAWSEAPAAGRAIMGKLRGEDVRVGDILRATALTRMMMDEYAKMAAGYAVYGLFWALLGKMLWPEDETKLASADPRSGGFGKISSGPTTLDVSAGLNTEFVHLSRQITEEIVKNGEVIPTTGDARPFGGKTWLDVSFEHARRKLAPLPAAFVNWKQGEDAMGDKTTLKGEIAKQFMPMTYPGIVDLWMKDPNKVRAAVLTGAAMIGEGVNVRK